MEPSSGRRPPAESKRVADHDGRHPGGCVEDAADGVVERGPCVERPGGGVVEPGPQPVEKADYAEGGVPFLVGVEEQADAVALQDVGMPGEAAMVDADGRWDQGER